MATSAVNESGTKKLRFADVAVTYTADEFQGTYRGKRYHEPDFSAVLNRAQDIGCSKLLLTTMTLKGAHENFQICKKYPSVCYMTLGVHPYHASEFYEDGDQVTELKELGHKLIAANEKAFVAFGEIGLDYDNLHRADKEFQQRAFRDQLELAVEFQLPLFLHVRAACDDFISIISPYLSKLKTPGLVHSFAGSKEEMLRLVDLGFHISVNGISFQTEELLDMVKHIPLTHLQLETDAPWCEISPKSPATRYLGDACPLPPSKKHGKFVEGQMVKGRNEPCTIERVARVVAGVKEMPLDELTEVAWKNSVEMFRLES
ncbi:Mg-dependent DNase [Cadophora sp. DSE1049]|nr:Mg-dependent DNase [Cadophora sp. DSE1049]